MTTLSMGDGSANFCGASLIAPQWVVSAAHCSGGGAVVGYLPPKKVIINAYKQNDPVAASETIDIEQIYLFPGYDIFGEKAEKDIALIKLASPSQYAPVKIPTLTQADLFETGAACRVLGWGSTNEQGTQSPILLQADIKVIDYQICRNSYANAAFPKLTDSVLCAGYLSGQTPAGAGSGDSGGPLIVEHDGEWVLIGIVSGGNGIITTAEHPGVYTKVFTYTDWINSHIATPTSSKNLEDLGPYIRLYAGSDQLRLHSLTTTAEPAELIVSDALGRIVSRKTIRLAALEDEIVDIGTWPPGCYFVALRTQKARFSGKFVKAG
jgi:secreted trypsin-like serine protease